MSGLSRKEKNPLTVLSSCRSLYVNRETIWLTKIKMLIELTILSACIFPSGQAFDAQKLRSDFLQVLRSRRVCEVPLRVEFAKPVAKPLCQDSAQPSAEASLDSWPKSNSSNIEDSLKEEKLYLTTEGGEQGRLPVLILSLKGNKHQRRPAVVLLHGTGSSKESLCPLLKAYASRGYVSIAIDSRYHGERAQSTTAYQDALISAWKTGKTMPFIYDTVWDLIKLADYLTHREDIDNARIGVTGISLGGMHAWFAAFADTRYAVVVPVIGVQGFLWAIDNDKWQARVDSIKPVFEVACDDLGKSAIDKEVVKKVWDRIAPGLASKFDSPYSIPAIAPRPLLILNGAEDPRCPLGGLKIPESNARNAYGEFHKPNNFKFIAQPGIAHQMTPYMTKEASEWFDRFFKAQFGI
ncbi:uncharacterized protein LOC114757351 isoform X2 [Neltuma alba]|uniref:uncharacterized protein LOC114757351 isoform X2 n=1 Tax=Neltuma alba TaxID=207710 RepID=UPI0010A4C325|nr:uncharacterized protein LOC114757351 isoform X2 [Prosopis alba]